MSNYKPDQDWDYWDQRAGATSRHQTEAVSRGSRDYEEWNRFQAGRTAAQLAVDLNRTETEINEMIAVFAACKEMADYASNQPGIYQSDRLYNWRQFGG